MRQYCGPCSRASTSTDVLLGALIGEMVSLNHRGEPSVAGDVDETLLRLSVVELKPSREGGTRSRLHTFGARLASRWALRGNRRPFLDGSRHVSTRQFVCDAKTRHRRSGGAISDRRWSSRPRRRRGHRESHRGRTTPSICASPSVEYGSHAAIISKVSSRCGMER